MYVAAVAHGDLLGLTDGKGDARRAEIVDVVINVSRADGGEVGY